MRRFNVTVLVLIGLGFVMTVLRDEPDSPARQPAADTVTVKHAKRVFVPRKANPAAPVAAEKRDAVLRSAANKPEVPQDTANGGQTLQGTAVEERQISGHLPGSPGGDLSTPKVAGNGNALAAVSENSEKLEPGEKTTSTPDYLPPWMHNKSRGADGGADIESKGKAKTMADAKPKHVTGRRDRTIYGTRSTSMNVDRFEFWRSH